MSDSARQACLSRGQGYTWTGTQCTKRGKGGEVVVVGGRRRTLKAKTLRRMLKKKGMKTTGKKATLLKRLHLRGGGVADNAAEGAGLGSQGELTGAGNIAKLGGRRSRRHY